MPPFVVVGHLTASNQENKEKVSSKNNATANHYQRKMLTVSQNS
jgi:hypothetical protein